MTDMGFRNSTEKCIERTGSAESLQVEACPICYRGILEDAVARRRYRCLVSVEENGKWLEYRGRRMLNLSSNDYLGLAARKDWYGEFLQNLDLPRSVFSASSSRLLTGNHAGYGRLEELLRKSYGKEAALVFNSGYAMNTGILPALCTESMLILADKWVHASIIDGIRLSRARCVRFRHQDMRQLEQLLENQAGSYDAVWIVTESLFSMSGDVSPLRTLVELKRRYGNVFLYMDEAHAIGVRGKDGLGIAQETGTTEDIDVLCGTFGKALASIGGFAVCKAYVREILVQKMRPLIYTTAMPPINIAWTEFVWRKMLECHQERAALDGLRRWTYRECGDCIPAVSAQEGISDSHILLWRAGDSGRAVCLAEKLRRKGFGLFAIRPPTVPESMAGIRLSLRADLRPEDLSDLIPLMRDCNEQI